MRRQPAVWGVVLAPQLEANHPFIAGKVLRLPDYSVSTMPYARRDATGQLLSLHRLVEPEAQEFIADDAAEVLAFMGQAPAQPEAGDNRFDQLDADFVRVLEDLVDTLVARNVINLTDLPARARDKLFERKGHRRDTALSRLNLLGESYDPEDAELPASYLPPN